MDTKEAQDYGRELYYMLKHAVCGGQRNYYYCLCGGYLERDWHVLVGLGLARVSDSASCSDGYTCFRVTDAGAQFLKSL